MTESLDIKKSVHTSLTRIEPDAEAPFQKRRTARDKLGTWNITVLGAGTILILLPICFLIWIWAVSLQESETRPLLWSLIAIHKWMSRVITICAILIRFATGAQLCIFAAIMAALVLETVGASPQDFPLLSMIRCANTGPQALIWYVYHTMKARSQLAYSLLIVITILNAFALQFTSTLLIADLDITMVLTNITHGNVNYGETNISTKNPYGGIDFWKTGPQSYPRFAEYRESSSNGTNFTDTGRNYRGFLPFFTPETRKNLRTYRGPMEIVDVRTVCVKPRLTNMTLWPVIQDETFENYPFVTGNVNIEGIFPEDITTRKSKDPGQDMSTTFNCSAPLLNYDPEAIAGNTSICLLDSPPGFLQGGFGSSAEYWRSAAHLVINATYLNNRYSVAAPEITPLLQLNSQTGPWTRIGNNNMTLDFSICLINPSPNYYNVIAWGSNTSQYTTDTDPFYMETSNYGKPALFTQYIQWIFGADGDYTSEDRHQMALHPPENWTSQLTMPKNKADDIQFIFDSLLGTASQTSDIESSNTNYQLSPLGPYSQLIHPRHAAVMTRILRDTQDPSLAIQALWTILLQMAYYDSASNYDLADKGEFGLAVEVIIPRSWNSFIAVMALLALHFILVSTVVYLFITRTKLSLLGNAWQAVSQVVSIDTADTVHHGAMATDKEMAARESVISDQTIKIATSANSGRTEATSTLRQ